MLVKQLNLLNKCTNDCSMHIYWMLTKFSKCHLYIYKDIRHFSKTVLTLHNNVFFTEKFNKYDCKTFKAVK
jgi:hypothetical protein